MINMHVYLGQYLFLTCIWRCWQDILLMYILLIYILLVCITCSLSILVRNRSRANDTYESYTYE